MDKVRTARPNSPSPHTTAGQTELSQVWMAETSVLWGDCDQKFINNEIAVFHLFSYLQPALCVVFMNTLIRGYESSEQY